MIARRPARAISGCNIEGRCRTACAPMKSPERRSCAPGHGAVGDDVGAATWKTLGLKAAMSRRTRWQAIGQMIFGTAGMDGTVRRPGPRWPERQDVRPSANRRGREHPGGAEIRPAGSAPGWRRRGHSCSFRKIARCGALRASSRLRLGSETARCNCWRLRSPSSDPWRRSARWTPAC